MIGMMYLVLLALLALTVQSEVLDAFVLVDESLTKTTENFSQKNQMVYADLDQAAAENPVKAGPWKTKADEVKKRSNELVGYIQELKLELVRASEGEDTDAIQEGEVYGMEIGGKDNMDKPGEHMITRGKGKQLQSAIEEYREYLLSLVGEGAPSVKESIATNLNTDDPPPRQGITHTWVTERFDHKPLIAVVALMTKLQSDVRNAESDIIQYLHSQIETGFSFNMLEATVIPKSNYVTQGGEYRAEVFLAAFDTTQAPTVLVGQYDSTVRDDGTVEYNMVGSYDSLPVEQGRGIFRRQASTIGPKRWAGLIQIKNLDGSLTKKPFRESFTVAPASLVVAPTRMNVFYLAVDNPVEISVPGYPSESISASINNGRINGSGNKWTVRPTREGNAAVSVAVTVDGQRRGMGSKPFRVKTVPDPYPTIAGRTKGVISTSNILRELGLKASMPEWFEFELEFNITEFSVSATVGGFYQEKRTTGANFTSEQRDLIRNLGPGQRIYFQDIKAVGPDGTERDLPLMSLRIQ